MLTSRIHKTLRNVVCANHGCISDTFATFQMSHWEMFLNALMVNLGTFHDKSVKESAQQTDIWLKAKRFVNGRSCLY